MTAIALGTPLPANSNALKNYVAADDTSFDWKRVAGHSTGQFQFIRLQMVSQTWREHVWNHDVLLVRPGPDGLRHPEIGFLFVTGDGDVEKYAGLLQTIAARSGAAAAVVNRVPNQPLYDGRKEDALIAHTFQQYFDTGDESWPLLFPMVKSAVRAMDAVQAVLQSDFDQPVGRFVVSGASKRGWTTWLTGAVDERVAGIAPMVIDMLNMKPQLEWAQKAWGRQSAQIRDYTDLRLHERMDEPAMRRLQSWVDPWSYLGDYTMPKLLLFGTNDPYWVVDAVRHYWTDLPDPKLIFQTPNAGHGLNGGDEAIPVLAEWFRRIAEGQPVPEVKWSYRADPDGWQVEVTSSEPIQQARLWTARSDIRDFREAEWKPAKVEPLPARKRATMPLEMPEAGFVAHLGELELEGGLRVSTEVKVLPDTLSAARRPENRADLERWLRNMIGHHRFDIAEVRAATGMSAAEVRTAVTEFGIRPESATSPAPDEPLKVLPYPGGRHPRITFLDGAIAPQRETKLSIFTPWDAAGYVVADIPEAIWWNEGLPRPGRRENRGLLYLAHTHVPTHWSQQGIELEPLEWKPVEGGGFEIERRLPNGVAFGARAIPHPDHLEIEQWLTNGTDRTLTGLRVQNCILLKAAKGFDRIDPDRPHEGKYYRTPYAAAQSQGAHTDRWVITAWEKCVRAWGNNRCPCLHSDPQFPDCAPGQTVRLRGWLSFYEGPELDRELDRIDALKWWEK